MKTKYIKPSVEVIVMKTTSPLAGSFEKQISQTPEVTESSQILSKGNNHYNVWGDDEE